MYKKKNSPRKIPGLFCLSNSKPLLLRADDCTVYHLMQQFSPQIYIIFELMVLHLLKMGDIQH